MTEVQDAAPAVPQLRRKAPERAARAVLPACAGSWTAAEIMHATGIPWLDIGLGTAAVAGVAYGKGARGGAGWLLAAGAWSALAAKLGPLAGPYLPLTDAWAVLSFCGWRWARSHPVVTAAREKRQASMDWLTKRDRWGLPKTHLLDWEPTRLGERYVIDTRGSGRRASQIVGSDAAERIAEERVLPPSRVRLSRHRLAGRVEIAIRETDPWAKPIPHPVLAEDPEINLSGPYSITHPAVVGQDPETGAPLSLLLCSPRGGRNVNVVATLDSGKTTLANCISERITAAPDALQFRINLSLKGDEERELWGPACHLTAFGPRELGRARKVLRVITGIVEWRSQQPKTTRNWVPSPGDPHLVLIVDEIDALTEDAACRRLLEHLNSKGRQYGYSSVRLGQRGTAEWTGGGNIRAVDGVICLGRVNRAMEAMHAAGDLGLRLPDMSEYGEGQPGVWAIADNETGGHMAGRSFDLGEPADIQRLVRERAHRQPDLKPELKAFLGGSYENLLRTDVYAKWARDQREPAPAVAHPRPDAPPDQPPGDWPDGLDPHNPLHALAVLTRDGVVKGDGGEGDAALAAALNVHERQQDSLSVYDRDMEEHMAGLDESDPLRRRWLEQGRRNDETRRLLAESRIAPDPDITPEQRAAYTEARWDAEAERTVIPDDMREKLLALVAGEGISARQAVNALGVPEASRARVTWWLNRLRWEGLVRLEGKGRGARWKLVPPPGDGDVP